ncbi:pepsin/retropepsin-like aspartic protease family protein [Pararhodonellum marinum]|uniref:pepsin/retropepsin-like aspartic protease family protein n=1 Tax=Pararhodonellum marinum TaxID=2755358 RepID=UPI00188F92D1|nr:pepsin/retropepsin-like aspartic protease family protein [Pararhodonellum marinum]
MKTIFIAIIMDLLLSLFSFSNPDVTRVPFQLIRNLVIVEASVNGKYGYFIMDTGVSEIILNDRYFNGKPTGDKFYGINGSEMDKAVDFIRINLGGFEKQGFAIVTDFSALEKNSGLELLGVIGNSVFRLCELVFDYIFKEVTIYELDKKGNRQSSKNIHLVPLDTLSFTFSNGIPLIEVERNGKRFKMRVDSGATANLMDIQNIDRHTSVPTQVKTQALASFGSSEVSVKSLLMEDFNVGKLSCPPMKTMFVNLDHFNKNQSGMKVDGILGYEFLSNFRVAINYRKKEIYLWDRKTVEFQWDIASSGKDNH